MCDFADGAGADKQKSAISNQEDKTGRYNDPHIGKTLTPGASHSDGKKPFSRTHGKGGA